MGGAERGRSRRASRRPSPAGWHTNGFHQVDGGSVTRRVVVTGVGLVSSLGLATQATWDGLLAGRSGVARITHFDPADFAAQIAAEVKGFDPLQFVDKKDVKKMDVFIQFAIAA